MECHTPSGKRRIRSKSVTAMSFTIKTRGRGAIEITQQIAEVVANSAVVDGLCNVFICHTSASLTICENADPTVLTDLEAFLERLVPDGDDLFEHTAEGPDDMPAHVRSVLTQTSISIPVRQGQLNLGRWQGIFVLEHRHRAHQRTVIVTVVG